MHEHGHSPCIVTLVELPHAGGVRMIGNPVEAVLESDDDAGLPYTLAYRRRR